MRLETSKCALAESRKLQPCSLAQECSILRILRMRSVQLRKSPRKGGHDLRAISACENPRFGNSAGDP